MAQNQRRRKLWPLELVLSFLLAHMAEGTALAQSKNNPANLLQDPAVNLTVTQVSDFSDALQALSAQAHVAFVAESQPLHSTLAKSDLPKPVLNLPLSAAVTQVADAYDYTAERQGNIFILKKKYTDPHDLPCVTLEECALALKDVVQVTSEYNPNITSAHLGIPLVLDVVNSFTPAQLQLLHGKRLPVSSLNSEQTFLVRRAALFNYVQPSVDDVRRAIGVFDNISRMQFSRTTTSGQPALQLSCPDGLHSLPRNYLLGAINGLPPEKNTTGTTFQAPLPQSDQTAPKEQKSSVTLAPTTSTLGQSVAALNQQGIHPQMAVDPALMEKLVTTVGIANTPPRAIEDALASVYGLRTKTDDDGKRRIIRPLFQSPDDIMELPAAVQGVMPEPFLRALHSAMAEELELQTRPSFDSEEDQSDLQKHKDPKPGKVPQENVQPGNRAAHQPEPFDNLLQLLKRPREIRTASAVRLISDVAPQLNPASDFTEGQLSEPDRQLLADFLLADCLMSLQNLTSRPVPNFIVHFDQMILGGGRDTLPSGKPMFSLNFYLLSDDNQLRELTGGSYFPRVPSDAHPTHTPLRSHNTSPGLG